MLGCDDRHIPCQTTTVSPARESLLPVPPATAKKGLLSRLPCGKTAATPPPAARGALQPVPLAMQRSMLSPGAQALTPADKAPVAAFSSPLSAGRRAEILTPGRCTRTPAMLA